MSEINTAAERAWLADPHLDTDSMFAVVGKCGDLLDKIDRLEAEKQRLREALLTADRVLEHLRSGIASGLRSVD